MNHLLITGETSQTSPSYPPPLEGERVEVKFKHGPSRESIPGSSEVEKSGLRVRAEIVQSQNRVIFWVAGLLLAQGALYLMLQKLFQLLP